MAFSDGEAEALPSTVSNYHFVDDRDEPISFHVLPIQWSEGERQGGKKVKIFLHGTVDNGIQEIYKHVIAWKFDLSKGKPEIFVLSKENNWLRLLKPRKSFEDTVRSILIMVQFLHYVKRNPETSYKSLCTHLSKVFSLYDVRHSHNDLLDHILLIRDSVERDDALARSKFLVNFLGEKPAKRQLSDEGIQGTKDLRFVVDHTEHDMIDGAENESSDIDSLFSSVCAFCDDGGDLLCCEGRCLRSFHPTVESAVGSDCKSLGFTKDELDATQNYFCNNCKYKQHQCFACGKLGPSDNSSGAEVVPCFSAICGRFYHPRCVAKLLYRDNGVSAEELEKKIAMGGSFTCPIHKCCVCKQGENKKERDLQFAVCMRCPKSYHRKCLPRKIAFAKGGGSDAERLLIPRAWEGLLPKRILIYCTKHEMNEEGRTIIRDHLKFPDVEAKKTVTEENTKILTSESLVGREKVVSKKMVSLDELYRVTIPTERSEQKQKPSAEEVGGRNGDKVFSGSDTLRKVTINTASKKEVKTFTSEEKKTSVGEHERSSSKINCEGECQKSLGHGNKRGNVTLGKLQHVGEEKHRRGMVEISSVNKRCGIANQHSELSKTGNMQFGMSNGGTQLNIRVDTGSCSQVCTCRQQVPDLARCNLVSQDSVYDRIGLQSSTTCGHQGLAADSFSGMKPLSMVPYAPQRDKSNCSMPTALVNSYGPGERKPGYLGNPLGFAPGPHQNYSVHNSAGWLDE
ncbi:hypothetical protein CerSpe_159880 [Prunus speciosa]